MSEITRSIIQGAYLYRNSVDMTWLMYIVMAAVVLVLIIFLTIKNKKDKKKFIDQLNKNYPKFKKEEDATDVDEIKK